MDIPPDFNSGNWPDVLDARKRLNPAPAVYALTLGEKFGRLRGVSDVLYIGETGELGGDSEKCRLRIYCYPNGDHARMLRAGVAALIAEGKKVAFRWQYVASKGDAEAEETRLLERYRSDHRELPPFNSRR